MTEQSYEYLTSEDPRRRFPIKGWTRGVPVDIVHTLKQVLCVKG